MAAGGTSRAMVPGKQGELNPQHSQGRRRWLPGDPPRRGLGPSSYPPTSSPFSFHLLLQCHLSLHHSLFSPLPIFFCFPHKLRVQCWEGRGIWKTGFPCIGLSNPTWPPSLGLPGARAELTQGKWRHRIPIRSESGEGVPPNAR